MATVKQRKEVTLDEKTILFLKAQAKNEGRTLKNYMEFVLSKAATEFEKEEEAKALEIRKALAISKSQSDKGMVKSNNEVLTTTLILFGVLLGRAQQDPNRPDNTYFSFDQYSFWTTLAASQPAFDTPVERANREFSEALAQNNAFSCAHKDLAYYVPRLAHSQVTNLVSEQGNVDANQVLLKNKIIAGELPGQDGALHIIRCWNEDGRGVAEGDPILNKRYCGLDMEDTQIDDKLHEFAHTFNHALHGSHDNCLLSVPYIFTPLGGSPSSQPGIPTVGANASGTKHNLYTTGAINSIGAPTVGGDGYVNYNAYDSNGNVIGNVAVNIDDLDVDQQPSDPNPSANDNVSDGIVDAINTGHPGFQPTTTSVNPEDEAPQPTFIVEDGKYKLTDGEEEDDLGFVFDDAFGNRLPAIIRYYPYDATNDVNDENLDLPPGYGSNGVSRGEAEAGIDKDFYDTNYPGVDIVWKRYSFKPNALGPSSEIITLDVEDFELNNSAVYPNPTENVLYIKSDAAIKSVEILNILGQKVQNITVTRSLADTPLNIDTSRYPSGTYLVKLTSDKGTVTKRVIKD